MCTERKGQVAQTVEHRPEKAGVRGSMPRLATQKSRYLRSDGVRGSSYVVRYREPANHSREPTFKRKAEAERFSSTVETVAPGRLKVDNVVFGKMMRAAVSRLIPVTTRVATSGSPRSNATRCRS